jgi:hypothetical protein
MTAKLPPMRSIALDALNLLNPAASMEPTHERDVREIVELLEGLTQTNPDLATQLDPTTLSRVLTATRDGNTLEQALEEICVCA